MRYGRMCLEVNISAIGNDLIFMANLVDISIALKKHSWKISSRGPHFEHK
jgi:hypothetical protein